MSLHSEVTQWLSEHWDPNMDLLSWRSLVADSGWGAPSWPSDYYGKDMSPQEASVVERAFTDFGAVGAAQSGVRMLAAVTLLAHGSHVSAVQRARQRLRFGRRNHTGRPARR